MDRNESPFKWLTYLTTLYTVYSLKIVNLFHRQNCKPFYLFYSTHSKYNNFKMFTNKYSTHYEVCMWTPPTLTPLKIYDFIARNKLLFIILSPTDYYYTYSDI